VADAAAGKHPNIEILADATSRIEAGIAQSAVGAAAPQAFGAELGPDFVKCATQKEPFTATIKPSTGGDITYDGGAHALAGMGIQFILIGALDAAIKLLEERQKGVLRRLRAAPLARAVLIASRLLSGALIAVLVLCALYAFGKITMNVTVRGPTEGFA